MPSGVGSQKPLHALRQSGDLLLGVDLVHSAIEAPDQLPAGDRLEQENTDPVDGAGSQLRFDE